MLTEFETTLSDLSEAMLQLINREELISGREWKIAKSKVFIFSMIYVRNRVKKMESVKPKASRI